MNRSRSVRRQLVSAAGLSVCACAFLARPAGAQLPEGYWDTDRTQPILDKTLEITLAPDLSHLSEGEHAAVGYLLAAGRIIHDLYEAQHHPESHRARARLEGLTSSQPGAATDNLQRLYRLFRGPIATTLDNERLPFLPVAEEVPGKAVYPPTMTREVINSYLETSPDVRNILAERTRVRQATEANLRADVATLDANPVLDVLHPGLRNRLLTTSVDPSQLYGTPYSVAWADSVLSVYELLLQAAEAVRTEDPDLFDYLTLRARDFLTGDYEAGDAAWVTGQFQNLNAEIGSYETYDDELLGVKAFYGMSLLLRDRAASDALARALTGLQAIEDRLPHEPHQAVRTQIPVGVYQIIADFGQSRGANTATILPNDADHSRKYGRTILLRYNIMTNETIFEQSLNRLKAATEPEFHGDLTLDGNFQRTLWHEVGHYLGVTLTQDGRVLDAALQQHADLFEEMKADLVSLYTASYLHETGYLSDGQLTSVYASGIRRVLQTNEPRRSQPYQTMQLMQWNFFMENGVLEFDSASGRMSIDYAPYHEAVGRLLAEVLAIQYAGDLERAGEFIDQYGYWHEDLHGVVAANIRDSIEYRYYLVRYASLDGE